jgi:transposase
LILILPALKTGIVKRSNQAKGFAVLPKRWIAGRTIAWLNRCRRLAKDWENLNLSALIFPRLASLRFMPRKLSNSESTSGTDSEQILNHFHSRRGAAFLLGKSWLKPIMPHA